MKKSTKDRVRKIITLAPLKSSLLNSFAWSLTAFDRHGRMVRFPFASTKQAHYKLKHTTSLRTHPKKINNKNWGRNVQKKTVWSTWAVCPFLVLSLDKSTPLKPILCINIRPWSSSPHAPIMPVETLNPAARPRIVLATLPPAIVRIWDRESAEGSMCVFNSLNISFNSSVLTYLTIEEQTNEYMPMSQLTWINNLIKLH